MVKNRIKKIPHIIAICGAPGSGKSQVQKNLWKGWDVIAVDDGYPLRDFAKSHLGLTLTDVFTQEGKLRTTTILDKDWQHRKLLGDLGKQLEAMFGADIMPFMATRNLSARCAYSFGSVRRSQASFYKALGGLVLGVRRAGLAPSPYDFDKFDESLVDLWIDNDGSLEDLKVSVSLFIDALPTAIPNLKWTL